MGGKAAILLVLGFSLIFLVVGRNFLNLSTRAIDNQWIYYNQSQAYNIAVSGANMAANQIFMDKYWATGYTDLTIGYGTVNVFVSNNTAGSSGKTIICHKPGTNAQKTMNVANASLGGHLGHGDYAGVCAGDPAYDAAIATIISEGTYNGVTKTVIVDLRPSSFAKFGNYYSSVSSAIPATGDVFDGPFHVEGNLKVYGSPQFNGKATANGSLQQIAGSGTPIFNGGFQSGVSVPMQFDTSGMRASADKIFKGTSTLGVDVQIEFLNERISYSTKLQGSSTWSSITTENISTTAPNGKIYVDGGNVYIKGALDGRVTISATTNGKSGYGNIYQTTDFLGYKKDPTKFANETSMLGLIAEQNIRILSSSNTRGKDIITQASMFAMNGNIGPDDDLATGQTVLRDWNILGGLIAKDVRVTANYSASTTLPINGLRFRHVYDTRFLTTVPPGFPGTGGFEIVGWYE